MIIMKKSLSVWLLCDEYYIGASRAQKKKKMTSILTMDDSALTNNHHKCK